jgi:hypothetical protein
MSLTTVSASMANVVELNVVVINYYIQFNNINQNDT